MNENNGYNLTEEEYEKLTNLSRKIHSTAVVVRYFCQNQPEIEELKYLTPTIEYLTSQADKLYARLIDMEH